MSEATATVESEDGCMIGEPRPHPGHGQDGCNWELATELLGRRRGALVEHAARYSICREDAEDALQLAVEKLLTRAPQRLAGPQMQRWMKTVVRNEALTIRRQRQRTLNVPEGDSRRASKFGELDWVSLLPAAGVDTEARVEFHEKVDRAHEALSALKPDERRSLSLLGKGYSYAEIQELTGWSYTKVNRCVAEGRKRFREKFASSESGELCDGFADAISRFVDGDRAAGEAGGLRAHLRSCANCRATLAAYRAAPKAAAALAPAMPIATLGDRLQELFALGQSRLPGRSATASDALLAPLASGGGARGGGMALLAKVAVVCAGAGGGAAACVAAGVAPTTAAIVGAQQVEAEAAAPDDSVEAPGSEVVWVEPESVPPGPAPDSLPGTGETHDTYAPKAPPPPPEPTVTEAEFGPEASGVAIAAPPATRTSPDAYVSEAPGAGTASGGGASATGGGGSNGAPTSGGGQASTGGGGSSGGGQSSDPQALPPVGGGSGEFGP